MAFSVADFTGVIASKGLASSNKFEVAIHFQDGIRNRSLELMCDTVSIAGKTIQSTADINYGIRREVAYAAPTYEAIALSFYCTEKLYEKTELDKWQNKIVKTNDGQNGGTFDIGYYDDYAKNAKIVVTKLGVTGDIVYKHEYREVYPKTISAIELSHGTSSGPVKVSATFNYIYWSDVTTNL